MFYMMTDHLSEAYKSIYQRKDLTSPPKDAEGMTGKMNPQGEPKLPRVEITRTRPNLW